MSISITDDHMSCDATGHTARRGEAGWQVSWLPGRTLTRNQAITAMTLGEAAGSGPRPGDRIWPHAEAWAGELGLPSAAAAIRMACTREASEQAGQVAQDADREAGS
jgi:hypothetical protein